MKKAPSATRALSAFLKKLGTNEVEVCKNPHVFRFYRQIRRFDVSTPTARKAAVEKIIEMIGMKNAYRVAVDNFQIASRGEIDFVALKSAPFDRPASA